MKINKQKRESRKELVIDYVKSEINKGHYPSYTELIEKFNIGFWRINLKDIYPKLGISLLDVPFKRPNNCKQELRN